jgi:hypothetical protein
MAASTFRDTLGSDVTAIAGLLSQLAGVLAAFSFASVLLVLERFDRDQRLDPSLAAVMSSFMSLLVAAFLYALVAGETDGTPRAYALNGIAGVVFGTGLLMMVNGLTHLLTTTRPTLFAGVVKLLVLAVPLTTLAYLDVAALDLAGALDGERVAVTSARFVVVLVPTLLLAAVVVVLWARWGSPPAPVIEWARRPAVQTRFERIVVLGLVTMIVAAAVVSRLPPDLHFPPTIVSLAPTLIAVALGFYTVGLHGRSVVSSRPARAEQPPSVRTQA